jgi:endoglucanase
MWRPLLLAFSLLVSVSTPAAAPCADWPAWSAFRDSLLRDGGRIIDPSDPRAITTSEGQSYALFFALVANDRADFDHLLDWTNTHLAKGNLGARLPAWLWGKPAHGEPTVLDDNSASDADLWIAYTLIEAGRLWHEPCYSTQGQLLAKHLLQGETADLPELGATLLPGALGFTPAPDTWRLNPS